MRISDWSSDVCSSDLGSEQDSEILSPLFGSGFGLREGAEPPPPGERQRRIHLVQIGSGVLAQLGRYAIGRARPPDPADRKSVVWGKGGSVRVDRGGGRLVKKTHRRHHPLHQPQPRKRIQL